MLAAGCATHEVKGSAQPTPLHVLDIVVPEKAFFVVINGRNDGIYMRSATVDRYDLVVCVMMASKLASRYLLIDRFIQGFRGALLRSFFTHEEASAYFNSVKSS
jgi:hypothetical protein